MNGVQGFCLLNAFVTGVNTAINYFQCMLDSYSLNPMLKLSHILMKPAYDNKNGFDLSA